MLVMRNQDSKIYSEEELDVIIRAFSDISDSTQSHEFYEQTGISDKDSAENYERAKNILMKKYHQTPCGLFEKEYK